MDKLLAQLLAFPPHPPPAKPLSEIDYDKQIRDLLKQLNGIPASQLLKPVNRTESLLDILDPSINSVPYLYTLLAQLNVEKAQSSLSPAQPIWNRINHFAHSFDAVQIRYVAQPFRQLLDELLHLGDRASDPNVASQALSLVQDAMIRFDPATSTFTSIHLALVKTCLRKCAYFSCLQILENDIYHFPQDVEHSKHHPLGSSRHLSSSTFISSGNGLSDKLSYRDHMQYFLYGAMIYISQKSWSRASLFLSLVLAAPVHGNAASMIQVEAYKKWILVNLLLHGRPQYLPRTISPQTTKLLHSLAKPYTALEEAFKHEGNHKMMGEYHAALEQRIWQSDNNLGLVKLVIGAHRRVQILSFSKIYSSIPLSTLAAQVAALELNQAESPAVVEDAIKSHINSSSINATILHGKDGTPMVKFLSVNGESQEPDSQQQARLRTSVAKVDALGTHVKDAQRRLELTKEYIEATRRKRKPNKEVGDGGPGGMSGISGGDEAGAIDEDMLAEF